MSPFAIDLISVNKGLRLVRELPKASFSTAGEIQSRVLQCRRYYTGQTPQGSVTRIGLLPDRLFSQKTLQTTGHRRDVVATVEGGPCLGKKTVRRDEYLENGSLYALQATNLHAATHSISTSV